jgi:hypothetical protein
VQRWLKDLELGAAAKKLAPLNDLLELPAARKSLPWRALGIAAGVALLLFAAYWAVNHRAMLPSLDSTASIRTPVSPAQPAAENAAPLSVTPAQTSAPSATSAKTPPPPLDRAKPPSVAAAPPAASKSPPTSHEAPISQPTSHQAQAPVAAAATPSGGAAPAPSSAAALAARAPAGASKMELTADTVEVPTGQPSAQITVHRKGSLRGETSFKWWTESGTAKPGADFSAVMPRLAYVADGKSNVSLSIPVSNAPRAQAKSFYVVIDNSDDGSTVAGRTLTMVTLLPSD